MSDRGELVRALYAGLRTDAHKDRGDAPYVGDEDGTTVCVDGWVDLGTVADAILSRYRLVPVETLGDRYLGGLTFTVDATLPPNVVEFRNAEGVVERIELT